MQLRLVTESRSQVQGFSGDSYYDLVLLWSTHQGRAHRVEARLMEGQAKSAAYLTSICFPLRSQENDVLQLQVSGLYKTSNIYFAVCKCIR